jgi:hypothetical protein
MGRQFTDKAIAAAKPKDKRYYIREGRGFALQVLPSGAKSFVYLFELNKSKGYVLLGHYPACTLAEARIAYNDAYKLVKKGIDPRDHKKAVKAENERLAKEAKDAAALAIQTALQLEKNTFETLTNDGIPENFTPATVEQLAAVWFVSYSKENHTRRWQETAVSAIKIHIIPNIGKMEITEVRHKHALGLIQQIATTTPGSARNTMKLN